MEQPMNDSQDYNKEAEKYIQSILTYLKILMKAMPLVEADGDFVKLLRQLDNEMEELLEMYDVKT